MRKFFILLVILAIIPLSSRAFDEDFSASNSISSSADEVVETVPPVDEDVVELLKALIEHNNITYDCTVYVFQFEDGLDVSVSVGSYANEFVFSDVLYGTMTACKFVTEEYYCPISQLSVTNGSETFLNWRTSDLETGFLADSRSVSPAVYKMPYEEVLEYYNYEPVEFNK